MVRDGRSAERIKDGFVRTGLAYVFEADIKG